MASGSLRVTSRTGLAIAGDSSGSARLTSPAAPCQPGRRGAGSRRNEECWPMDLGLRGRRALVMGGTKGLGRSIADALAAEGAALVISGRDQGRLDEAA